MEKLTRIVVGTVAAGAMAAATASPALARDHNGIDAGDVIAGALVIGGIAAVAAAASNNNRYDYDYGYGYGRDYSDRYGYGYGRGMSPRDAVEQCVRVAERAANRYSFGGRAKVTDIRDVGRKDYGYRVKGRIAVNTMGRDWYRGDGDYGRGWNRDYRGWNSSLRGYDAGTFDCKVDYRGGIRDLDFDGIRGL